MDTDNLTDDLAAFLASHEREAAYRVDKVLKRAPGETTELVYFVGANGSELGPFVRKSIELSAGIGQAYDALWRAQRAGARFAHLPRLLECRASGDQLTVIMEYIEGETVASLVARVGASPELACRIMPGICEAVAELHGAFDPVMIHRDLKPSNIMVVGGSGLGSGCEPHRAGTGCSDGLPDGHPTAVLIDFGIARTHRRDAEADTTRFGTRGYAAPEQFGFGQTDVRSDVYALGALAAFCCTGVQPVGAIDADALAASGASEALRRAIVKAASFDPAERFASADAFRVALVEARDCSSTGAYSPVGPEPVFDSAAAVASPEKADHVAVASSSKLARQRDSSHQVRKVSSPPHRFARVPRAVGIAWNIVLVLVFLVLCTAYASVVIEPMGSNALEPRWYVFSIAMLLFVPETALILALVADRRRWPERLPLIGEPTFGRLFCALLVTLVGGFMALLVLTAIKGA